MTDDPEDFSFLTSSSVDSIKVPLKNIDFDSSLDSYSNLFDKAKHNFSASSEKSIIHCNNEQLDKNPLSTVDYNQTFIKEFSKTIINAFTGKPISPNPWRKLSTKNVQHQMDTEKIVPIEVLPSRSEIKSPNQDKVAPQRHSNSKMAARQSRRDMMRNQRSIDSSEDDDQTFEQSFQEHRTPIEFEKYQQKTPIRRRRKKGNNLQDFIDRASSSSDESIKEYSSEATSKVDHSSHNDPSWRRLADVYTSEESDESNHFPSSNTNLIIRLKSEVYTSDPSTPSLSSAASSTDSVSKTDNRSSLQNDISNTPFNFLESLSEHVSIENKHRDAKPYFISPGFNLKEKRRELSDKLLLLFNHDVFSSQLSNKISVVWSGRLTVTAGHCTTRRTTRTALITLSHKVCNSPERCRDTLLHEMCHAAVTLIDGVMEHGHGPLWRQWTRMVERCYPCLPLISVKHTYDVTYKFIYRCLRCQYEAYRHSQSLNPNADFCSKCMGRFELIINNNRDKTNEAKQVPKKKINKYNLFVKKNFIIMKQENPHLSTPQLMKKISAEYRERNQPQLIDLPDLSQLKI